MCIHVNINKTLDMHDSVCRCSPVDYAQGERGLCVRDSNICHHNNTPILNPQTNAQQPLFIDICGQELYLWTEKTEYI